MNARHNCLSISVEHRQLKEALLCLVGTTLLHRVVPKFNYDTNNLKNYSLGSIGYEEVTLESIDLTYARVNSPKLIDVVDQEVTKFVDSIKQLQSITSGELSYGSPFGTRQGTVTSIDDYPPLLTTKLTLEFFKKRRRPWPLSEDIFPWEVWSIALNVVKAERQEDFQRLREDVGEKLSEQVLKICQTVNQPRMYLPPVPQYSDLGLIFDCNFPDVQPYLFRLEYDSGKAPEFGLTDNFKKFFKESMHQF
uniref:Autophagy-related protein 101 n=1 Tax=Panagrellus redivivus TaxID=6233 RepID=A0A7E4UNW1_PANRE